MKDTSGIQNIGEEKDASEMKILLEESKIFPN